MLLFDQNLSFRLVKLLSAEFPGSASVRQVGLERADDSVIWLYAKKNNLVIVSKDSDFPDRSLLHGSPPKVVWLRVGNCSVIVVADLLRKYARELLDFITDPNEAVLVLSL